MKNFTRAYLVILLFCSINICKPIISYAAFPIATNQEEQVKTKKQFAQKTINHTQQRVVANNNTDDKGILGVISLILGVAGFLVSTLGMALVLLLGAFIAGLLGVQSTRKLKGLAIVGLILGIVGLGILLLMGVGA